MNSNNTMMTTISAQEKDLASAQRDEEIEQFITKFSIQLTKKKKRKLMESSKDGFEIWKLSIEISNCCKDMDLESAYQCFQKSKEVKVLLSVHTMTNLLCLAAGLGEIGCGNLRQRTFEPPKDVNKALEIFAHMKANNITVTEASYSSIIRCCCDYQRWQDALNIYEEMKSKEVQPKLRSVTSLFDGFSQPNAFIELILPSGMKMNQFELCNYLYSDCMNLFNLILSEKEYFYLLRISFHSLQSDSFFHYFHILMEELLVLTHQETIDLIKEFFRSLPPTSSSTSSSSSYQVEDSFVSTEGIISINKQKLLSIDLKEEIQQDLLEKIQSFAVNRDSNAKYKPNNKIKFLHSSLYQNTSNTTTTTTTTTKSNVNITDGTNQVDLAIPMVQDETSGKKNDGDQPAPTTMKSKAEIFDKENRLKQWTSFENHLQSLHERYCISSSSSAPVGEKKYKNFIILDGANIGYYKQNFSGAPNYIHYQQIQHVLDKLVSPPSSTSSPSSLSDPNPPQNHQHYLDEYFPIIILHSRHLSPQLNHNTKEYQEIQTLLTSWKNANYLYTTPKGFNDDWFWMYATIKYHCYIITNDDMRDHHFQLLSPRYFLRWRERHRVNYTISYYCQYNDELRKNQFFFNRLYFQWPRKFSFRIQYLNNDQYEGYYLPPLQKEKKIVSSSMNHEHDNNNNGRDEDDDYPSSKKEKVDNDEHGDRPQEGFDHQEQDESEESEEEEEEEQEANEENVALKVLDLTTEKMKKKIWTCIFRKKDEWKKRMRSADEVSRNSQDDNLNPIPSNEESSISGNQHKKSKI